MPKRASLVQRLEAATATAAADSSSSLAARQRPLLVGAVRHLIDDLLRYFCGDEAVDRATAAPVPQLSEEACTAFQVCAMPCECAAIPQHL